MLLAAAIVPGCGERPLDDSGTSPGDDLGAVDTGTPDSAGGDVGEDAAPTDTAAQDSGIDAAQADAAMDDTATLDTGAAMLDTVLEDTADAAADDAGLTADAAETALPDSQGGADAEADAAGNDAAPAEDVPNLDVAPPPKPCTAATDCSTDLPCKAPACVEGTCGTVDAPKGTPCDDGSACTYNDSCFNGKCWGKKKPCKPKSACHTAACDPKTGACDSTQKPENAACNDGDKCTENDICDAAGTCKGKKKFKFTSCGINGCFTWWCIDGKCEPKAPKSCNDYNSCTFDSCDDKTGDCTNTGFDDGTACDDGQKCTKNDKCSALMCIGKPEKPGCDGMPVDVCGDFQCKKGESAKACPWDCDSEVKLRLFTLIAACGELGKTCANNKDCVDTMGCLYLCKKPFDGPKAPDYQQCFQKCSDNATKLAWDIYLALAKCGDKVGLENKK